ncbi:MAG: PrsW family intramembrane metalloprotease [Lachnospiraceae bacterium]|nr:PrsW family intramembrane metalloprotease [Lachnospiraceae bacterium]
MIYIENVYICLAAPVLIAVLCLRNDRRRNTAFLLGGMTACILSSYITTFLAMVLGAEGEYAAIDIAPFVEEAVKLSPVLFYMFAFRPKKEKLPESILMVSVGFATFENVCYLLNNGVENFADLLIRGFGTGAMHVICGALVSVGLLWLWENRWLRIVGTVGLLSVAITYHGVYNILVNQTGIPLVIGCMIPVFTMGMFWLVRRQIQFFV